VRPVIDSGGREDVVYVLYNSFVERDLWRVKEWVAT
jgi:hypothetical protein